MFNLKRRAGLTAIPLLVVTALVLPPTISFGLWKLHITGKLDRSSQPECPHEWKEFIVRKQAVGAVATEKVTGNLSISGPATNIPEFNDCQRFAMTDKKYGPLVAIFASYRLDTLTDSLAKWLSDAKQLSGGDMAKYNTAAISVAEIFNHDMSTYGPLDIRPGFSCLSLFYKAGVLQARLTNVGASETDCLKAYDPAADPGTKLTVKELSITGFAESDYPWVARWDWDPTNGNQYIGIRCGRLRWCEIGPDNFASSDAWLTGAPAATPQNRVRHIKGWYDQQLLDIPVEGDANVPPAFEFSSVVGTVFPHPDLKQRTQIDYEGKWLATGYVAMSGPLPYYKKKFNYEPVSAGAELKDMNILEMCYGKWGECIPDGTTVAKHCGPFNKTWSKVQPRWWVRITAANSKAVFYKCVVRRGHENLQLGVPGTSRWRWLAADPTVWEECLQGCCMVEKGEG